MDDLLETYPQLPFRHRFACTAIVICLFLIIMSPKDGNYYPEGNWLWGPLWCFYSRNLLDKIIGAIFATMLMTVCTAVLLKPAYWTAALSFLGIITWTAIGAFLAMAAVV